MENHIRKNYICPISKMIFYEPVAADDGIVYEGKFIRDWLEQNKKSPITGNEMTDKLVPLVLIKNSVILHFV